MSAIDPPYYRLNRLVSTPGEFTLQPLMNSLRKRWKKAANRPATDHADDDARPLKSIPNANADACARPITKIVSFAQTQSAHIIGLTSDRKGVGVSLIAGQVAAAYGNFGKRVVILDTSELSLDDTEQPAFKATQSTINLKDVRVSLDPNVDYVDVASVASCFTDRHSYRRALDVVASEYDVTIVDLPPVSLDSGRPNTTFLSSGTACDLVFMVCLTGTVKREELSDCLETCRIGGVKISGVILSDWKLPGSRLLST